MNYITELEVNTKQLNILNKAGLYFYEQLTRLKPKKLYDCREEILLCKENVGRGGMIKGTLKSIETKISKSGIDMTQAVVKSTRNNEEVGITWFHTTYPFERYYSSIGKDVLVYGKIQADNFSYTRKFCMISPIIFTDYLPEYEGKIISAMKKYKGLSVDYFNRIINHANSLDLEEYMPDRIRSKYNLYSLKELNNALHNPESIEELKKGFKQVDVEDLTYFAVEMIKTYQITKEGAPKIIKTEVLEKAVNELPFTLTDGQKEALNGLVKNIRSESELNALVQGDVSCGKSIVAYLLMLLFAENGYQTMLLAPTIVLASQHYKDAEEFFNKYGFKVAFINGTLKKKDRLSLLKDLEEGNIDVLIGTHAAVNEDVKFKNLGIAIVDEEQRFGVECRERVKTKAPEGKQIVYVSMSATPIPRTLATCLYGEGTGIYSIASMPNGRQSVDTIISNKFEVPKILRDELKAGRQGYVVCALIDDDVEEDEGNPIISVEKTKKAYEKALPGYRVEALTGKTKEAETLRIMEEYKEGKINVLISTTVIEVGVNNPNSSVIVIQNAERFGLSTLHQLRGRVRRGTYKPYCILESLDEGNERLRALAATEDGFKLSKMDLELRRSGNLLGIEQSGKNHFVELLLSKPNTYEYAKGIAKDMIENKEEGHFLDVIRSIYNPV